MKAAEIGANTFQIFSSSPRTWRAVPPDPYQVKRLQEARKNKDLAPMVIHANYLINLAADDPALRAQSMASYRGEVERAIAIGAEYLVVHPGSYGSQGLEKGICALAASLIEATRGLNSRRLTLLVENTAGGGTKLGGCFEELHAIRELARKYVKFEIGYCIDTAHCFVSQYNVATPEGLKSTVQQAEKVLGLENVRVIHANDSKAPFGSHNDRHQHIGEGFIGAEAFGRILNHPKLRAIPFILETPRDKEGDDLRNVETLKSLCRKRPTTTKRSS